jgi:hypothetical protein
MEIEDGGRRIEDSPVMGAAEAAPAVGKRRKAALARRRAGGCAIAVRLLRPATLGLGIVRVFRLIGRCDRFLSRIGPVSHQYPSSIGNYFLIFNSKIVGYVRDTYRAVSGQYLESVQCPIPVHRQTEVSALHSSVDIIRLSDGGA